MRLIRPMLVVRVLSTLLGVAVCLPASAADDHRRAEEAAAAARQASAAKPAPTATTTTTAKKKPAYSATTSNARKTRLATARASVRAREQARLHSLASLQEAMTPRFKTDADGQVVPDVRAAAAIIFNPITGQVLYEENSQDKRSIASITKVMTALVYLEDNPDLNAEVTIERSDVFAASTTYLKANDRITASRAAAPAADSVRQRRRPRAGAHLARRHRGVRRAHEREGDRARAAEHLASPIRRASTPTTSRRPSTSRTSSPSPRATSGSRRSCARRPTRSRPTAA